MEDINVPEKKKNMEETSENSAKKIYGDHITKIENINEQNNNRIQVSNTKKPLFFYLNLAKRYMKQHDDLELSAMGMEVLLSTVGTKEDAKCQIVQKAKIEILPGKVENGRKIKITAAAAPKINAGKKVMERSQSPIATTEP